MLQIKVFQLAGNYKALVEASASGRRHVENQLGVLGRQKMTNNYSLPAAICSTDHWINF